MTGQMPLLKYTWRDCHFGWDMDFDTNYCKGTGEASSYEDMKGELWQLQLPDGQDFPTRNVPYFNRYEIHAVGDPNPVIIQFYQLGTAYNEIKTYRLPDDYVPINNGVGYWWQGANRNVIQPILCEYERCRGAWQTRIVAEGDGR